MRIERVNKNATDKLENVTVVFISKNPFDNVTYIVGWYRHATLYRQLQKRPQQKGVSEKNIYYAASTKIENAICLSENERNFEVPTSQKMGKNRGYGKSPIWYLNTKEIQPYRRKVEKYLSEFIPTNFDKEKNIWHVGKVDPEHNKEIERKAVNIVTAYYKQNGFEVESVEELDKGFDLIVSKGRKVLFVEVKGNGSSQINISLSPNEYNALKQYKNYIIASVINCNEKNAKLNLFKLAAGEDNFYIQHIENKDEKYKIFEITSARIIDNNKSR